ncbi:conserved hypothetical protein [Ricinus communis]|uniref:Uncharacterized protein n=1 Tax=Ricinus communis TaxID=3988 RepID=B9RU32_RICCO|nr:conserved hypothetical protein [Ricinus communis]
MKGKYFFKDLIGLILLGIDGVYLQDELFFQKSSIGTLEMVKDIRPLRMLGFPPSFHTRLISYLLNLFVTIQCLIILIQVSNRGRYSNLALSLLGALYYGFGNYT